MREHDTTERSPIPLRDPWTLLALGLGALLLLAELGDSSLSADEAQTTVLARTILQRGLPWAFDGRNMMGIAHHPEVDASGLWAMHPWLPLYLCAGSFALFGVGPAAARLPFALCGLAALVLALRLTWQLCRDLRALRYASWLLVTSLPLLLHVRQARYYPLAMLLALAWISLDGRRGLRARFGEVGLALCLFHTHYLVFAGTALGILGWRLLRGRRRQAVGIALALAALATPWLLLVNAPSAPAKAGWPFRPYFQLRFLADLNDWLLPFALLPLLAWGIARHPRRDALLLLAAPILSTILIVPLPAVTPGVRYLCVALCLVPVLLAAVLARMRWGGLLLLVLLTTNLCSWSLWAVTFWPARLLGSQRAAHLLKQLGPAARPGLPLLPFAHELLTRDEAWSEVVGAWLAARVQPDQRALLTGNIETLAFYADVPLARTLPPSWLLAPHLGAPHVVPTGAQATPPAPGSYAWYIPGCGERFGMPHDLGSWLGFDGATIHELPVAPCPRHNPADPRTHRFAPTPTTPATRIYQLEDGR